MKDDEGDADDARTESKKIRSKPRRGALSIILNTLVGTVAVAAAGTGFRAWQTGAGGNLFQGPAFDPWRAWEAGTVEGVEGIITAAILAPSPHNTQPWKFVVGDNTLDLFVDADRNLGAVDPIGREMFIGLGCALENMVIGARAMGFSPIVNLFPAGQAPVSRTGGHVARLILYNGERNKSVEATALARRHTNRGPYIRGRVVPNDIVEKLNGAVQQEQTRLVWVPADSAFGTVFHDGTLEATQAFLADSDMHSTSSSWFRHDLKTVNAKADGLTTTTFGLTPLKTRGALMLSQAMIGDPHARWFEMTRDVHLATAPQFGIIAVPNLADKAALLEAGRLWQRLHLIGTINGLAMQPLNQMMEIADRDRVLQRPSTMADKLAGIIGYQDSVAAFGFRMGYAERLANPSPRRSAKQVIAA